MYAFKFSYKDGAEFIIDNVSKVTFLRKETVTIESDKMLTYPFPLDKDLHLFGETLNTVVSSDNLRYITISQQ